MIDKFFSFDYEESMLLKKSDLMDVCSSLSSEIQFLNQAKNQKYDTPYSFINLPSDKELLSSILNMVDALKKLKPTIFVLIGIGGSNLGTLALFQALYRRTSLGKNFNTRICFVDGIDDEIVYGILAMVEHELKMGNNIVINIVTKSGLTTETLVNASLFIDLLKRYKNDYNKFVVITSNINSPLHIIAKQESFYFLEIPKLIIGRFSVFSAVGLFPLAFFNIDINSLLLGAESILSNSLSESFEENYSALSASIIYSHILNGKKILDNFIFVPSLFNLCQWYRQLIAESLGKKYNKHDNEVRAGIMPTTSVATNDLHSVLQLYLGGPNDRITTFINVKLEPEMLYTPANEFSVLIEGLSKKSLTFLKKTIAKSVKASYLLEKKPFISIQFKEKNAYYLGQFLMFKMIEVVYLGYLMNVNCFDQPEIEHYKNETRKILMQN